VLLKQCGTDMVITKEEEEWSIAEFYNTAKDGDDNTIWKLLAQAEGSNLTSKIFGMILLRFGLLQHIAIQQKVVQVHRNSGGLFPLNRY